ncbi:MAG: DUF4254 domain-containing protein [Helicobacteraceae bacterium]|jgi:uncharacterized membrane protein YheB (UPF0754 family)|nr:DUF4254 domain-containing protein [Helicobacteraceae bacterium]
MNFTERAYAIFIRSIADYHILDSIDSEPKNPYADRSIEFYLYLKNWIDTVQWHLEDIIRDPHINSERALEIKRRIDRFNQERTDLVEMIDGFFYNWYKDTETLKDATFSTESPAWAIDRLSILALKIFHMRKETERNDIDANQRLLVEDKLEVLLTQKDDLSLAIEQLLADIESGKKYMKVYKQMKMYNDPSLNPILYARQ